MNPEDAKAQRDRAASRGEPYAVPFDLGIQWDTGAPLPVVISALRTFVAFYLPLDFDVDGTNPRMRTSRDDNPVGVVEFIGTTAVRMGDPNDEALRGHALWGRGLGYYSAHFVENSPWIRELTDTNRVHERFREETWRDCRHYLFTFHDETFDCVARDHQVRVEQGGLRVVAKRLAEEACG